MMRAFLDAGLGRRDYIAAREPVPKRSPHQSALPVLWRAADRDLRLSQARSTAGVPGRQRRWRRQPRSADLRRQSLGIQPFGYSHSIVPGGFDVMSYTTRLTSGTSL